MQRLLGAIFIVFGILMISEPSTALRPDETCELCQSVLTHTYYTYLQQSTRKIVTHRINHNCKRYANYKRRCLLTLLPKAPAIFEDMRSSVVGEYRAFKTCINLKECSELLEKTSVADHMPDEYIDAVLNGTAKEHNHLVGDVLTGDELRHNQTTSTTVDPQIVL